MSKNWTKEDFKHSHEDWASSGHFLPIKSNGKEVLGWISDIPLGYDLLQASLKNPLYDKWECKHVHELSKRIEENRDVLQKIQNARRKMIFNRLDQAENELEEIMHFTNVIDYQPESDWLTRLRADLMKKFEMIKEAKNNRVEKSSKTQRRISLIELQEMVDLANNLVDEDSRNIPTRKNALLSNNLKTDLSREMELSKSAIHERFKKYCDKVGEHYHLKQSVHKIG